MNAERPPIQEHDIEETLEHPDHDTGREARRWIGARTIIVYYDEKEDISVRAVSATSRRLAT